MEGLWFQRKELKFLPLMLLFSLRREEEMERYRTMAIPFFLLGLWLLIFIVIGTIYGMIKGISLIFFLFPLAGVIYLNYVTIYIGLIMPKKTIREKKE